MAELKLDQIGQVGGPTLAQVDAAAAGIAALGTPFGMKSAYPANASAFPLQAGEYIGFLSSNCRVMDSRTSSNRGSMSRSAHKARTSIRAISFVLANWFVPNTTPHIESGQGAMTYLASCEYPVATYNQFTFPPSVRDGEVVITPLIGLTIPRDATFYSKVNQLAGTGLLYTSAGQSSQLGETMVSSANAAIDTTNAAATGSAGTNTNYVPLAIIGPTSGKAALLIGDSQLDGRADTPDLSSDMGTVARGVSPFAGYCNAGNTGDSFLEFNRSPEKRLYMLRYAKNAIFNYANNDIANGSTLAQLKASAITAWTSARSAAYYSGTRIGQTTCTPKTTSTDFWTTLANQTAATNFSTAGNGTRELWNDWLRDGAPMLNGAAAAIGAAGVLRAGDVGHPLNYVVDICTVLESSVNSGKWRVDLARVVSDAAITTATNTLTSATANFTSADVDKTVSIAGVTFSGFSPPVILSVTNSTTVVLSQNAVGTASAAALRMGMAVLDGVHPGLVFNKLTMPLWPDSLLA